MGRKFVKKKCDGHTAIIGLQWGDEGKGAEVDREASHHDVIVRCQGGNNAGHTVVADGKTYVLHLIPSGILRKNKTCVAGQGMVVDPFSVVDEIKYLEDKGVSVSSSNFLISDRASLLMPYHVLLDYAKEVHSARENPSKTIGTTLRGIGPAYEAKVGRRALRFCDLLRGKSEFKELVSSEAEFVLSTVKDHYGLDVDDVNNFKKILKERKVFLPGISKVRICPWRFFDISKLVNALDKVGRVLRSHIEDVSSFLYDVNKKGDRILFEGAQGAMLDIYSGTYPFVTSSNTGVGGIVAGSGVNFPLERIVGVAKAYTTRVGGGPFPSELNDDVGRQLQEVGKEYGATTGRPRRCGWFDAVVVNHAVKVNGVTDITLTKLDVLDSLPKIDVDKVGIVKSYNLDGFEIAHFPASIDDVARVKPLISNVPSWEKSVVSGKLTREALHYLGNLESFVDAHISRVSYGADRENVICLN